MALSAIGEGCHQQMEAILQEIVSFVLLFCNDQVGNTLTVNVLIQRTLVSSGYLVKTHCDVQ